jgi:hypothetical protein
MKGTLSGRSLCIFQATLKLTLSRIFWKLRFPAGMKRGYWVQRIQGLRFYFPERGPEVFVHHRKISGEGFRILDEGQ